MSNAKIREACPFCGRRDMREACKNEITDADTNDELKSLVLDIWAAYNECNWKGRALYRHAFLTRMKALGLTDEE